MRQPRAMAATAPAADAPAPIEAPREHAAPVEIELKLEVPGTARDALRRRLDAYGTQPAVPVASVYFDTAGRRLASLGAALRLRRVGDRPEAGWIQTLKTEDHPGAFSRRGEWEAQVPGPRPVLSGLPDWPLQDLLGDGQAPLVPVFRTQFERTARTVRFEDAVIEVAFDEGTIVAGRRREPICELELELRAGSPSTVFALAQQLVGLGRQALALRPSIDSKAARGYRLAHRVRARPVPADAKGFSDLLQTHRTHLEVARRVVAHGVHRVLANAAGAASGEDLEYVHQARVALRRTRSALRVLGVARAPDDPVARDLRWMADCFGAMRDWDVLLTETLPSLRKAIDGGNDAQWERLIERAQAQRRRQSVRLRAVLGSARFARAALALLQWAEEPAAPTSVRLMHRARRAIERGHGRLTAAARKLADLPPADRHRVRILAKRQRYALELLGPLLSRGVPGRTLKQLSRLQQLLGEINDVHVAVSMLPRLTRSRDLIERAQRWSEKVVRRNLPKAQTRLQRLSRCRAGL
jgi:triphosphatase